MSKQDAKNDILTGLGSLAILIFGYLLLKTINPDILNLNIGVARLNLGDENGDGYIPPENPRLDPIIIPTNTSKSCKEGYDRVHGVMVCKSVARNFGLMIDAAKADGLNLSGYGFRTYESQVNLRRSHCGPTEYDIYKKPSKQCHPRTAIPGTSRHESGLATDFTCDGKTINIVSRPQTKKCFDWMVQNAHKYGYYNLPDENWHWSIDGH